jgi:hypothetical protein
VEDGDEEIATLQTEYFSKPCRKSLFSGIENAENDSEEGSSRGGPALGLALPLSVSFNFQLCIADSMTCPDVCFSRSRMFASTKNVRSRQRAVIFVSSSGPVMPFVERLRNVPTSARR